MLVIIKDNTYLLQTHFKFNIFKLILLHNINNFKIINFKLLSYFKQENMISKVVFGKPDIGGLD